jgi:hypothetical protein
MARLFDDASSEYLKWDGTPPVSGEPFAMGCLFRSDDAAANQTLMWIGDKDVSDQGYGVRANGASGGDPVGAYSYAGSFVSANTTSGFSANVWHHALGVWATSSDRRAMIDGGNKGTESTSMSPSGWDRLAIGVLGRNTPSLAGYTSGRIAEAAIWDLSAWPGATDGDKADEFERVCATALAAGFSPLFFPLGLVAYWPLGGMLSTDDADVDIIGGYDMTAVNTPSTAEHYSGLILPARIGSVIASAGGGVDINCTLGTATISSYAASVEAGTTIDATLGTVTIASNAATVEQGTTVDCTLGTVTIAAHSAEVEQGTTVDCTLGTVTIAALSAEVEQGTTVDCTLGTVTIAAHAATVEAGTTVSCSLGTVTIASYAATVETGVDVDCTLGTVTIASHAAEVEVGTTVDCTLGAVVIAALAATVEISATTAITHYHNLRGPSRERYRLRGPSKRRYSLKGPSQERYRLKGGR